MCDHVAKSLDHPVVKTSESIPEKWMRELLVQMNAGMGAIMTTLQQNIILWYKGQEAKPNLIQKAIDWTPLRRVRRVLTRRQLEELKRVIQAHFEAAGYNTESDMWRRYGLHETTPASLIDAVQTAYVIGRLGDIAGHLDLPFHEIIDIARKPILTRVDELALLHHRESFESSFGRLGGRVRDDLMLIATDSNRAIADAVIDSYLAGEMKPAPYTGARAPVPLTGREIEGVRHEQWVTNERQLASSLRRYFIDDPQERNRDWWRVAVSETRAATNTGRMAKMVEDGSQEFYYLVQPDACKYCKGAYLNVDGSPKLFNTEEVFRRALRTNGMNIGRSLPKMLNPDHPSEQPAAMPNALLHPNCNCIPVPHVSGFNHITIQGRNDAL